MTQHNENRGRDQNIINQPQTVNIYGQAKPPRPRNETLLLQAVKDEVNGRLEQSLHNAVLINLGKQAQPEQVKRPWDAEVKIGSKAPESLSPETTIWEVFNRKEIAGKLLILGDPGSGKTTTMLDLAQALVQKAEEDANYPIPVLLNLSSWKDPKQAMNDWLLEELRSKYGVWKGIGKQWLTEKQLLPLLDGLDEVKPEHQQFCVQAINQWLQSELRPRQLVVCSRWEEYSYYRTCLELNGAISLQSLTELQIQVYLTTVQQLTLWQFLQHDAALLKLLRIPLLLSITVLSYRALSLGQWQHMTSTEKRLELLLDAYIQKMLHREIKSQAYEKLKHPTAKQTRHWLITLAQKLQPESQTEFLIEKMQPRTWLMIGEQKRTYQLISSLSFGLFGGLIFGLIGALSDKLDSIETIEAIQISYPNQGIWRAAINLLFTALIFGLIGLVSGLIFGLVRGLIWGLIGGLISGLIYGLPKGGGACIQHITLRFVLFRNRLIPWNYARFLNYCTERLLLQRIGGRYRFIHKLLQDHFAAMPLERE